MRYKKDANHLFDASNQVSVEVKQDNVPDKDTSHLEVDRQSVSVGETSIFTYYAKNSAGQDITDDISERLSFWCVRVYDSYPRDVRFEKQDRNKYRIQYTPQNEFGDNVTFVVKYKKSFAHFFDVSNQVSVEVKQDNVPNKDTSHLDVDRKSVSIGETSILCVLNPVFIPILLFKSYVKRITARTHLFSYQAF